MKRWYLHGGPIVCLLGTGAFLIQPVYPASNPDSSTLYQLTIEPKSTNAVSYQRLSGSTKIDFRGTPFAPDARGFAVIGSRRGAMTIHAKFENLDPASKYEPNNLTYVLWAVSPEGRSENLGELILDEGRGELDVTTSMQTFALLVTAEPYFAVTKMGNVVVLENVVRKDTDGKVVEVNTVHELFDRDGTTLSVNPADLKPVKMDKKIPLDLYQARNAVKIAQLANADAYATEVFQRAQMILNQAEDLHSKRKNKKRVLTLSREAVQTAEDARVIALRRREVEKAGKETTQNPKGKSNQQSELKKKLDAIIETKETANGLSINLPEILFAKGDAELRPEGREKLNKISDAVLAFPGVKLEVKGYADMIGDELTVDLSQDRAQAVRAYFIAKGVPGNSITAQGYGGEKPFPTNDRDEGQPKKNMGVQLVITETSTVF